MELVIKQCAKKYAKSLGLLAPARKIWQFLKGSPQHGHVLLIEIMRDDCKSDRCREKCVCIEIGSTRSTDEQKGSSVIIAQACQQLDFQFETVDMDPANIEAIVGQIQAVNPTFKATAMPGEKFLESFTQPIHYLYLDAFDYDHSEHTQQRQSRYQQFLGTSITNEACYKAHLDFCQRALPNLSKGAVVVFDDVWKEQEGYGGKGKTAIPYLLSQGFKIERYTGNTLSMRKQ